MKRIHRILCIVMALTLLIVMSSVAFASDGYTYTVRIFGGEQGLVNGQEVIVYQDLHYGDRVNFNYSMVTLNDGSKYYVRGIRESGKDNNTVGLNSFAVTQDMDYVVAYGILGNAVAYTIQYVDPEGNELAPSETYYGNVGDKPVVACLYIEGYQPQHYNLTKTLVEDASENVFPFTYNPIVAPATPSPSPSSSAAPTTQPGGVVPYTPTIQVPSTNPTTAPASPTASPAATTAAPGATAAPAGPDTSEAPETTMTPVMPSSQPGAVTQPNTSQAPAAEDIPETEEIGDLDVPLGEYEADASPTPETLNPEGPTARSSHPFRTAAIIGGSILGLAILGVVLWFLLVRRRKDDEG